jgi:hypothetical protein
VAQRMARRIEARAMILFFVLGMLSLMDRVGIADSREIYRKRWLIAKRTQWMVSVSI